MCKCERKAETVLIITLLLVVFLEFYASEQSKGELKTNKTVESMNSDTLPAIIVICLLVVSWILLYIILFSAETTSVRKPPKQY